MRTHVLSKYVRININERNHHVRILLTAVCMPACVSSQTVKLLDRGVGVQGPRGQDTGLEGQWEVRVLLSKHVTSSLSPRGFEPFPLVV